MPRIAPTPWIVVATSVVIACAAPPKDATYLKAKGNKHIADGEFAQAIETLEESAELDPRDPRVHLALGGAFISLGRFDEGIDSLTEATELDPQDYYAWLTLGAALKSVDRFEQAKTAFRRALALKPADALVIGSLADAAYRAGEPEDCVAGFDDYFALMGARDPSLFTERDRETLAYAREVREVCEAQLRRNSDASGTPFLADRVDFGRFSTESEDVVERTAVIPCRLEELFGVSFTLRGGGDRTDIALLVQWDHPGIAPGRGLPPRTETRLVARPDASRLPGPYFIGWRLASPVELVEGRWAVAIHDGSALVLSQEFSVTDCSRS